MRRSALGLASLCSLAVAFAPLRASDPAERATNEVAPARWTAADSAALDRRIEELEERLLAHQARVAFWHELRDRHGQVSAVACENLAEHASAMRTTQARNTVRFAEQRRGRVASAAVE